MEKLTHKTLPSGVELGCIELPGRRAVALEFRLRTGIADEPSDYLGLARLMQETIDLGTESHDGRGLSDAFDEIGASHGAWTGRESTAYPCLVLPEFLGRAIELHAEFLRTPTFPDEVVDVAIELTRQEINALQDDAHALCEKLLDAQVYGPLLGRHALGEPETLDRIKRTQLVDHWRAVYHAGRMQVTAAGAFDTSELIDLLEKHFDGFGAAEPAGRSHFEVTFRADRVHHHKELEQQHIGIAFRGVSMTDPDYAVQRVMLGVLSGGMSSRLFTEVREKQGLVYWVSAWGEMPRGAGMLFLGASTTPERCEITYATLLREVDRLSEDLTQEEVSRAATGIIARIETRGDITRSRCSELADDIFHYGHPISQEEKIAKVQAVTADDVRRYLSENPRNELSVLTLGPRPPEGAHLAGPVPVGASQS